MKDKQKKETSTIPGNMTNSNNIFNFYAMPHIYIYNSLKITCS